MRSLRKLLYTILLMGSLFTTVSCEDLAFGDKFLQKPPSSDVTIDTIFSVTSLRNRNFRLLDTNVARNFGRFNRFEL